MRLALSRVAVATKGETDAPTLRLYEDDLKDLPLASVLATLRGMEKTEEFFPSVATIRKAVKALIERALYQPLSHRPPACETCEGTTWVDAEPIYVSYSEKPLRSVKRCPDCWPKKEGTP